VFKPSLVFVYMPPSPLPPPPQKKKKKKKKREKKERIGFLALQQSFEARIPKSGWLGQN
jgi:hypothetical protein